MGMKALLIIDQAGDPPLAQTEILGASILARTTADLLDAGVEEVRVLVADGKDGDKPAASPRVRMSRTAGKELWKAARTAIDGWKESAAVLVMRLDHYCEFDWEDLFSHHERHQGRLTRVWAAEGHPLDAFVIDPKFEREVDFLFHTGLRHTRMPAVRYMQHEEDYSHPLRSRRDLREIAHDALHLVCRMRPVGREVRPGVWLGENVRIAPGARLVAPVFIGNQSRVRRGAVITRGSAVEHHSVVDCGTVVENTTVLAYTTVGVGLDLSGSVVGKRRVWDLKRNVEVEIQDPTLITEVSRHAGVRILAKAASLATYLPLQFWRGLTARTALTPATVAEGCTTQSAATAIQPSVPARPRLGPELILERYGNQ